MERLKEQNKKFNPNKKNKVKDRPDEKRWDEECHIAKKELKEERIQRR